MTAEDVTNCLESLSGGIVHVLSGSRGFACTLYSECLTL